MESNEFSREKAGSPTRSREGNRLTYRSWLGEESRLSPPASKTGREAFTSSGSSVSGY